MYVKAGFDASAVSPAVFGADSNGNAIFSAGADSPAALLPGVVISSALSTATVPTPQNGIDVTVSEALSTAESIFLLIFFMIYLPHLLTFEEPPVAAFEYIARISVASFESILPSPFTSAAFL